MSLWEKVFVFVLQLTDLLAFHTEIKRKMHRQDRYLACLIIIAQIQITEGTYFMLFPAYLFIVKFKMSRYSFNSFGYYVKLFF